MRDELTEKVSYAMVQSMIGYGAGDPSRASEMQPGQNARLSNFKSEANLGGL